MESHVLVVAADGKVRHALATELRKKGCRVTLAENGSQAERVVQNVAVETALVESHLPDISSGELRTRLEGIRPGCRVVELTDFSLVRNTPELLRFGSSDCLIRLEQVLELLRPTAADAGPAGSWHEPATQALIRVIDVLVGLLELEDHRFDSTSHVAMELARATAEELELDGDLMLEVVLGTLLRDIGRTGPGQQAAAEGAFSDDERNRFVREHVTSSLRMLEHLDFPWKVLGVVRHHHERYNGSGAPDGLRGREIPMGARIVSVVDAYVALSAGKGQQSLSAEDALQVLARRTGHQFDPEVVEAFHRVIDKQLAPRRGKGKPLVVVVDHDAQFRRVLKVRLGNVGLKVVEARDYEKCKEQLLKQPPDLALIGIDADTQGAFHLLDEIQQDECLCQVPILFLATRSDRALKIRALRQGVDDYLVKGENLEELVARVENILVRGTIRAEGEARRTRRGITGSLENLSLPDIVQTLTIGMKTACVTLACGERSGRIWFEDGAPKHAESADLAGEQAFYEMVRWETGEFVIEHGARSRRTSIDRDAMFLLMEGLRLIDEAGGAEQVAL